ncbi:MAG: FadR/GntR family transcriptional regulator [Pseudomonadota bacterium]
MAKTADFDPDRLLHSATADLAPGRGAGAITARLRNAIETGVYAEGDQLPPERQLATAFDAARSTIRKALNQLENAGLVERRIGSGTYVSYSGPISDQGDEIIDLVSPLQLIEARFAIEPYMTRQAALHATRRDLDNIEAILVRLEDTRIDEAVFTHWDGEFHQQLARCSRNPLIVKLYQNINEVRSHAQWRAMRRTILTPEQIDLYNQQHRAIYKALCERDLKAASGGIEAHLETARQDLIGAESG